MAAIPCQDYFGATITSVPLRLRCTNRTCLRNRFVNFVASLDLSPAQRDEAGEGILAWTLWDIPASHAAQIDDDRGEDLICVSIQDKVYWLDWERYMDEWEWNGYAPIRRMVRFGPIPSNDEETKGYDLGTVKRFNSFDWSLDDGATGAPEAFWDVTVAEWKNEDKTQRTGTRRTTARMRATVSVKGRAFVVKLEHSSNEPITLTYWRATWDDLGNRIKESGVVTR